MAYKLGNKLTFSYKGAQLEGILVTKHEQADTEFLVIKLDNGYNIGVKEKDLKVIKTEGPNIKPFKADKVTQRKGLPQVSIIHTGGTIASKVDYTTGAVVALFSSEEFLTLFPELREKVNVRSIDLLNIQSEMMRFETYTQIAKAVEAEVKAGSKAVIITHGTDTMHYTSAALSFLLENLPVPVVLVGSQRSSDRGSSDASSNLLAAVDYSLKTGCKGVMICMHKTSSDTEHIILPGTNARKMHTTRRDAFHAINSLPLATLTKQKIIEYPGRNEGCSEIKDFKRWRLNDKLKIGLLKCHPSMHIEEIMSYSGFDALIIEGTGLGHIPILTYPENEKIWKELKKLVKKMPVAITSQAIFGRINLNVYTPLRMLKEIGMWGHNTDMTTECAFVKLAFIMSNFPRTKWKELYHKNMRGEISVRTQYNYYPLRHPEIKEKKN
ncbi:Glu-tRNA(Gln) amidotransferase subunit GatD [Candidatus Woesearchaeota archaeon]|nr:Glu-tRNA(Gln) amidotransferase subunit GatD [Candidatus Woesearchaeota archaeon]